MHMQHLAPRRRPDRALFHLQEVGIAPDQLEVSNADRTFLLCPAPQRSVFAGGIENSGGLDVNDASNWSCKS